MAMGIVNPEDFAKEISNTRPRTSNTKIPIATPPPSKIIDLPTPGRNEGDVNVPNSLRQVIGESTITDGRQQAVALGDHFGISPSSVSAYSRGATSTASYDNRPNESIIKNSKTKVQKRAMSKLMAALAHITPDKLSEAKARDLAGIAKDMSAVVKTMEPDDESTKRDGTSLPQFVVFAPQFRDERQYDVIIAKE